MSKNVGSVVAQFTKKYMPEIIKASSTFKAKDYKQALHDAFMEIDKRLQSAEGKNELEKINAADTNKISPMLETPDAKELANYVGCTSCVALITRNEIYVANAGDSRCVLARGGIAINMSEDHKPDQEREKERIKKAEGYVEDNRVNGVINLSRSLGDLDYKQNKKLSAEEQMIIAKPDIRVEKLTKECDFLILACDGIWDCVSSQGAVDFIREQIAKSAFKMAKPLKLSQTIEALFEKIIASDVESSGNLLISKRTRWNRLRQYDLCSGALRSSLSLNKDLRYYFISMSFF